jgi:hypothetical protein
MHAAGGDFFTQIGFFLFLAAIVSWEATMGHKKGVHSMLRKFAALAAAYCAAIFLRVPAGHLLHAFGLPLLISELAGGALCGMGAFFGALHFSRPAQTPKHEVEPVDPTPISRSSRMGGSALGAIFGIGLAWLVLQGVLLMGTLLQDGDDSPRVASAPEQTKVAEANTPTAAPAVVNPTPTPAPEPRRQLPSWARGLVNLKDSLRSGVAGGMVRQVDAVDPSVYRVLLKLGQMISRPEAIERFSKFPSVSHLMQHKGIEQLEANPEVSAKLERSDLMSLVWDPRLVALANDPAFAKDLRSLELEQALDFALAAPVAAPPELVREWVGTR